MQRTVTTVVGVVLLAFVDERFQSHQIVVDSCIGEKCFFFCFLVLIYFDIAIDHWLPAVQMPRSKSISSNVWAAEDDLHLHTPSEPWLACKPLSILFTPYCLYSQSIQY